jgi:hypothetical protein
MRNSPADGLWGPASNVDAHTENAHHSTREAHIRVAVARVLYGRKNPPAYRFSDWLSASLAAAAALVMVEKNDFTMAMIAAISWVSGCPGARVRISHAMHAVRSCPSALRMANAGVGWKRCSSCNRTWHKTAQATHGISYDSTQQNQGRVCDDTYMVRRSWFM